MSRYVETSRSVSASDVAKSEGVPVDAVEMDKVFPGCIRWKVNAESEPVEDDEE